MSLPGCRVTRLSAAVSQPVKAISLIRTSRFHRFARDAPAKEIASATQEDGACIIKGFYTPDQVRRFNAEIDTAMSRLQAGRAPTNEPSEDEEALQIFHGNQTKRLWSLCSLSKTWREELIDLDAMHEICDEAIGKSLGDYWLSTAQVIEVGPNSEGQPLHIDGAQWWPSWEMDWRRAQGMMLNFLVAGVNTRAENGATCVIPGSHRFDYSDFDPEREESPASWKEEDAVPVELDAGDCLLLGGRMVHRGGANTTMDEFRRVLTVTVVSSAFTPEEAGPLLMGRDVVDGLSERARAFVGLRERRPLGSIGVWTGETGDMKKVLGY